MSIFAAIFRPAQPIPEDCQANFSHLYGDVAWFGLLNGSILAFTAIYAARLGADLHLLGLLSAAPAIVNLVFALPAGRWLEKNAANAPVFWSSFVARLFYLLFIPLPWIFGSNNIGQIWAILLITFIMNVPNTALSIGFNAMFGDVVPNEWRAYVAGVRNSLMAVTTIVATLGCGELLIRVPFPAGYQIMFVIGCIGGAMSCYHLWFLRPKGHPAAAIPNTAARRQNLLEGDAEADPPEPLPITRRRMAFRQALQNLMFRPDVLKGQYGKIIGLLFSFHLAQYLSIPLFSIFTVDNLHFSDQTLSIGTAIYNMTLFIGSTQLMRLTIRMGNRKVIGYGVILISTFPALLALSHGPALYFIANLISGFSWAMIGGALFNYLLDMAPENERPAHMAWYNLALNGAILVGSLSGPLIANSISIVTALFLFALFRLLSGVAILRWG